MTTKLMGVKKCYRVKELRTKSTYENVWDECGVCPKFEECIKINGFDA